MNNRYLINILNTLNSEGFAAFLLFENGYMSEYNQIAEALYKLNSCKEENFFLWCKKNLLTSPIKKKELSKQKNIYKTISYPDYKTVLCWTSLSNFYQGKTLILGAETSPKKLLVEKFISIKHKYAKAKSYAQQVELNITGNPVSKETSITENIDNIKFYLENIIDQLPVSVYWKSTDNVYVRGNQVAADIVGLNSGSDFKGKTDEDFAIKLNWADEVIYNFNKQNNQVLSGFSIVNFEEKPFQTARGNLIHQLTNRVPLTNKDKTIGGILGASIEISDKVLANKLFIKNQELNLTLERYKQFLSDQEHDVRTPNIAIISAATAILEQQYNELSTENKIMLQGILDSALALLDYNDSLLNALILNEPNQSLVETRFAIHVILDRVFSMNKVSANHKNIDYTLSID